MAKEINGDVKIKIRELMDYVGFKPNTHPLSKSLPIEGDLETLFLMAYNKTIKEDTLITILDKFGFYECLTTRMEERTWRKYSTIKEYLDGTSVLDIGAGSGELGKHISQHGNKDVTLVDVIDINKTDLPLKVYDGYTLPFTDNSFDTTMVYVVLHHCNNPDKAFEEAVRVSKKRVISVEAVAETKDEHIVNSFFDWFFNAIMLKAGEMNIPHNYKTHEHWHNKIKDMGLKTIEERNLGWYHLPLLPEHRFLYVIDKV